MCAKKEPAFLRVEYPLGGPNNPAFLREKQHVSGGGSALGSAVADDLGRLLSLWDRLDDAQDQLAQTRKDAEEELQREMRARLLDTLKGLKERQEGQVAESERLFPKVYGPILRHLLDELAERLPSKKREDVTRAVGHRLAAEYRSAVSADNFSDRVVQAVTLPPIGEDAGPTEAPD